MSDTFTPRDARAFGNAMGRSATDMAAATERSANRLGQAAARGTNAGGRSVFSAFDAALGTSMAWWDLMSKMQRASLASLSVYSPGSDTRISATQPGRATEGNAVLPVGEERLNVATRTVQGETTRIRRRVVATPVEQEVTLRDERIVVERRPGRQTEAQPGEVLTETVIEMSETHQVPQVWKTVHVAEEVVLRREVTERTERVRETLHRDVIEVEQDTRSTPDLARPAEKTVGRSVAAEVVLPASRAEPVPAQPRAEAEPQPDQAAEERRRREAAKDQPQQPGPGNRKV